MKIVFQVNGGIGDNFIDSNATSPATCGVIAGGFKNKYCAGIHYLSIFSGHNNTVAGNCSAILGGVNNYDGGLDFVGIFGQSVTGVIPNAFHAENFVGQNMPGPYVYPGPLPYPAGSKAFFYCCDPTTLLCHVLIA